MILSVEKLSHQFNRNGQTIEVLRDVNLNVAASQVVAIQGESGSGKTTLLLACGAMQKPTCGTVTLEKQNVYALSVAKRARYRAGQIGYLFQTLQLLPYLNALDNVQLVPGVSGDTAKQWLVRLGLENRLHHKPDSLSHGQRQRVALARAIAHQPALIIADEPTGNLDPKHAQLVFDTLREFANDGGSVLIASHDPAVASIADQTYSLQSGTLADVGAAV